MDPAPDRYVDVDGDGVKLAVDDRGEGGVPLLLVHGFTGSRVDFAEVIDDLAADRRVVAWDHRGHAGSTNTGDIATYTFDRLVADMEVLVDALGLGAFHLLGHSMGGVVAMRYTLAHRARVASLVLMDTLARPQFIPTEFMESMITRARRDGMEALAAGAVEFERRHPRGPAENRDVLLRRLRDKHANMDAAAFEALGRELTRFEPLLDRLAGEVRCPTTVIVGENDPGLREAATELAEAIAGAVEVVIPDAAHSPQEENPPAWLATVRDHLTRAERPS